MVKQWAFPSMSINGEKLEILRGSVLIEEGKEEREKSETVYFTQDVLSAEVFLAGFDMQYTREGHDHELLRLRVDAKVERVGPFPREMEDMDSRQKQRVILKFTFVLKDEDTSWNDDFNNCWIGYVVVAHTRAP